MKVLSPSEKLESKRSFEAKFKNGKIIVLVECRNTGEHAYAIDVYLCIGPLFFLCLVGIETQSSGITCPNFSVILVASLICMLVM